MDILHRQQIGELRCSVPIVISNHPEGEALARFYGVEFHHIPTGTASKKQAEQAQLQLLKDKSIDLIVLARYMQILSPEFVRLYPERIINVHHSFLPAFIGARPYHAAFNRGVKLIGATSHYVTEDLDDGPIIDQDVARISHRDQVRDLIQKGRDLERVVLSRAVNWHLEYRVLCYGNKTIVFD
jgi:formyltetrahydrofolate deformylase